MYRFNECFWIHHIWGPCLIRSTNHLFPCFGAFSCDISSQPTAVDQKSSLLFGPVQLFLLPLWHGGLPCSARDIRLDRLPSCIPLEEDPCAQCVALGDYRRKSTLWFRFSNAIFSFNCDWESYFCHLFMPGGVINYDWLLRVNLRDMAWASLEVQWCLQGSLTPSLSVLFPSCFTYNSLLCSPDLSVELTMCFLWSCSKPGQTCSTNRKPI